MHHLAYIPASTDKLVLRKLLQQPQEKHPGPSVNVQNCDSKQDMRSPLTKQQLADLLGRLTKNTKKQYNLQQQAVNIMHANKELQLKRLAGDKVENRLISKGKERNQKIIDLGEHLEKEKKEKYYREVPEISQKGRFKQQLSIDRRLNELLNQKELKKQQLKAKYQPSFHPKVDPHSEFINDIENLGDLHNRMAIKQTEAAKRKSQIIKKLTEDQQRQLTFQPKINEKSKQIAESLPPRQIIGKSSHNHSVTQTEVHSFAPTINKNTDRFLSTRNKEQDCFRRLYKQAKELTIKKEKQIEQRNKGQSFRPTINKKSIEIATSKKDKQGKAQSVIAKTHADSCQDLQQIRIGSDSDYKRERAYSLKSNSVIKRPWIEDEMPTLGALGVFVSRRSLVR